MTETTEAVHELTLTAGTTPVEWVTAVVALALAAPGLAVTVGWSWRVFRWAAGL